MSKSVDTRDGVEIVPTHDSNKILDATIINGNNNTNGNLVSESTHSIDVLSGGESDAGDTLSRSRRNNNSISSGFNINTLRDGTTDRKKRGNGDLAYCIAKQLLMTERTYKRDLQLVTVTWSVSVSALASSRAELVEALGRGCLALEPIALSQGAFLARLETGLADTHSHTTDNDGPGYRRIAELLFEYLTNTADEASISEICGLCRPLWETVVLPTKPTTHSAGMRLSRAHTASDAAFVLAYMSYINRAGVLVARLESARRGELAHTAEATCSTFDTQSPLPLYCLLLRPLHTLHYYRRLTTELSQVTEVSLSRKLHDLVLKLSEAAEEQLTHAENHAALCQLQRDILGYDKLLVAEREFLRLGCVYKHSSKGLQQRMLFLFSDILICASKASGGTQFRAHSVLPLHTLQIEPCELPHSFTVTDDEGTSLMLSASNELEYVGWVDSIERAIDLATQNPLQVDTELTPYEQDVVLTSSSSSNSMTSTGGGALMHVCWHRATSLSREHLHLAMKTQLSGYLLRKFKNSHGWQKLWVVFAAFALFFYKSWQDETPLASLPLLGYSVGPPAETDAINKEFVFKLQYKNHVYFFRADSHYTYTKWTEALQTAMVHSHHTKC